MITKSLVPFRSFPFSLVVVKTYPEPCFCRSSLSFSRTTSHMAHAPRACLRARCSCTRSYQLLLRRYPAATMRPLFVIRFQGFPVRYGGVFGEGIGVCGS